MSTETRAQKCKSNFSQVEIQQTIDDLETRIFDLRLTVLAAESLRQFLSPFDLEEEKLVAEPGDTADRT
jgi:hypothetical protein